MTFKVAILTTSRADYGIYRPVIRAIDAHERLTPVMFVTGQHLDDAHGRTIKQIEADGYEIAAAFNCLNESDTELGVASAMAAATQGCADALNKVRPDILLTLGDRFEMLAAAMAAVPFRIPIAHIHGGEETEGAMDNVFRHALSKISQFHFCSTEEARRRILQMGEVPDQVIWSGAPGVEAFESLPPSDRLEVLTSLELPTDAQFALVTYHPVTNRPRETSQEVRSMVAAMEANPDLQFILTGVNADLQRDEVVNVLTSFVERSANATMRTSLGPLYASGMQHAEFMIGNSSSGVIEAASFGLPVVNIGGRQEGRTRSKNTIDVDGDTDRIKAAIATARDPEFRKGAEAAGNAYYQPGTSALIATTLAERLETGLSVEKAFQWY